MDNDEIQQLWPESWYKVLYSDSVVKISTNGKKLNQKQYLKSGSFPVIDQGQNRVAGYADDIELTINCDFPVIVFGDHTRTVKFVKQPFVAGADGVKVVQPEKFIQPKLLEYFTQYLAISIKDKGYARHFQWVEKEYIGIPPKKEQHRIVAKIEELFSELDKGIESLKTAREQLKVYRQALLKHAFEGKLTEQWREDNADKLESADDLLARIQQERETRYQQQLDDWKAAVKQWEEKGKEGRKPGKAKKAKVIETHEFSQKNLYELPTGWVWLQLGNNNVNVFDGPFGSNLKTSDYKESGVRVIRLENIGFLEFIEDKKTYISKEKYLYLKKHQVGPRDIVFSSFVTEKIRVAMIPYSIDKAINKADCFCIRGYGNSLNHFYLTSFLSSRYVFKQIEELVHGVGRPRINTTQLKSIWIPICSSSEQIEVVQLLDEQFSDIDKLLEDVDKNLLKTEVLRQSILKKAFSGQLVLQEPNDEPASILLERIKAEKAEQDKQAKARKTTKRKLKS